MENEIGLGKLINLLGSFSMILRLTAFAAEEAYPQGCNGKEVELLVSEKQEKGCPENTFS
ncbi:hypothetical protein LG52_2320 [Geobacillus kaustophilus]|uniref:Uncharacterized protein n=1 Tax=Geobacillus kaustophilus TaxID=1462 RepID=A0A0D8BPC2_GEOKU|nr:hypothetical protein LG52_2320 [Geobacillus kaustophilus]